MSNPKKSAFDLSMEALVGLEAEASGPEVREIALANIREDPDQPRTDLDTDKAKAKLAELAETIKDRGVLQPITVRSADPVTGIHMIRWGHRRFRASLMAGATTIFAIIDDGDGNEVDHEFDQVIENEQREPLSTMQLAAFVGRQLKKGMKPGEIARRLGKPNSTITNLAQIVDLPEALSPVSMLGARTLAELNAAYKLDAAATVEFIEGREVDAITQVAARNFHQSLKVADDGAVNAPQADQKPAPSPVVADAEEAPSEGRGEPSAPPAGGVASSAAVSPPAPSPAASDVVVPFAQAKGGDAPKSARVPEIIEQAKDNAQRERDGFVMDGPAEDALRRLFKIAQGDTGQSAIVARFLMAWWNAADLGGFDLAEVFGVDRAIALDLSCVFAFLASRPSAVYANNLGLKAEMELVLRMHRPDLFRR